MSVISDIKGYIDNTNYGEVKFSVTRVNGKTVRIDTTAEETLRYVNTEEAIEDVVLLVRRLVDASFTGKTSVELTLKDGEITLIGVRDKKETKY